MGMRLLREVEARKYLGDVSHGTFWSWRKDGILKPIKVKGLLLYDIQDLDAFIEKLRSSQPEKAHAS
jgi:hypothetical protein